eukprot:9489155-Pyramimonas_sp.AAC.2
MIVPVLSVETVQIVETSPPWRSLGALLGAASWGPPGRFLEGGREGGRREKRGGRREEDSQAVRTGDVQSITIRVPTNKWV